MDDLFGPYQRTRERVCTLLVDATPDDLARTVPACPDWTVHDLAAHLVGTPAELAAGRFPSGGDVCGRRTADELRALPADGDPEPYLLLIAGHLPLPERPLGE